MARESLYDYCIRTGKTKLLEQFDAGENAPLTPQTVSYGSKRKLWWHCERGHSWQAPPYSRTAGSGCPYCQGKAILTGGNDLASLHPALAAEWNAEKNAPLSPASISPNSHKSVWWRCGRGHEWRAVIKSRVTGCGCPVCANRVAVPGENTLADRCPQLCKEWDRERNAPLTPEKVLPGTRRKVWWKCEKGHSWDATIASRAAGIGCPVCSGKTILPGENDLETMFPRIAAHWDHEKNKGLSPDRISSGSNRRVWWICDKGHSYCAAVASRTHAGGGCPYCANHKVLPGFNDLATLNPQVAGQWNYELNGALTPDQVIAGSHRKVWWKCPLGHEWKAVVYSRTSNRPTGCPVCAGRTGGSNIHPRSLIDRTL